MSSPENKLAHQVIGLAIQVHRKLGPGLFESTYEACLEHLLKKHRFKVQRQAVLPLVFEGIELETAYRVDMLINDILILELKAVEELHDVHLAQVLTYLKLTETRLGLLINFNVPYLGQGITRVVNGLPNE